MNFYEHRIVLEKKFLFSQKKDIYFFPCNEYDSIILSQLFEYNRFSKFHYYKDGLYVKPFDSDTRLENKNIVFLFKPYNDKFFITSVDTTNWSIYYWYIKFRLRKSITSANPHVRIVPVSTPSVRINLNDEEDFTLNEPHFVVNKTIIGLLNNASLSNSKEYYH